MQGTPGKEGQLVSRKDRHRCLDEDKEERGGMGPRTQVGTTGERRGEEGGLGLQCSPSALHSDT